MAFLTPSSLIPFLLPEKAETLRNCLNSIANKSEKGAIPSFAARIYALSIPLFSVAHVPLFVLRGLTGSVSFALEGEFAKAVVKLKDEMTHALQVLAFAVTAIVWSLTGLFFGSKVLTFWRTEPVVKVDLFAPLKEEIAEKNQRIGTLISEKNQAVTFSQALGREKEELSEQLNTVQHANEDLREEYENLSRRCLQKEIEHSELVDDFSRKEQSYHHQTEDLKRQLQYAQKASENLSQKYEAFLEEYRSMKAKSEEEQNALIDKLLQEAKEIERLEGLNKELLENQEKLEKELLDSLGYDDMGDLSMSGSRAATPPDGRHEAFEILLDQLLDDKRTLPVWQIHNKGGVFKVSGIQVERLDPFTASVLTFMLIKGYEKSKKGQAEQAQFTQLIGVINTIVSQFPKDQKELEIHSLLQTLAESMPDTTPGDSVRDLVNLIIGKSTERAIHHPFVRASIALKELEDSFGEAIVYEILDYYALKNEMTLNARDVAMLVVGIAANMDLPTAKHLFETEDEAVIIEKLMALRKSALAFANDNVLVPSVSQDKQLKKDLALLDALVKVGTEDETATQFQNPKRLACLEYLARDLAYYLFDPAFSNFNLSGGGVTQFKENMLVSVAGLTSKPRLHQVHLLVREAGVYGVTLLPVTPTEEDEGIILFRGTFDLASTCRDIGFWERETYELWEGPGAKSYKKYESVILQNFKKAIDGKGINKWIGVGHSLGGSDTCRFINSVISENDVTLGKIDLFTFNAPHVEGKTREQFYKKIGKHTDCRFFVTHFEGQGDIVPRFGSKLASDAHSATYIFKQEKASNSYVLAHTNPWFTRGGDPTLHLAPLNRRDELAAMDSVVS